MKRFVISLVISIGMTAGISAEVVRNYISSSGPKIVFSVDSVDYRSSLIRVYGRIEGRPHTSNRIDEVRLTGCEQEADATDIDGVDFHRYFQWEDDGCIPIELDFPRMKACDAMTFIFITAHGRSETVVKKTSAKHQ